MDKNLTWNQFDNGVLHPDEHNLNQMRDILNKTGCGFCLAKFRQVTMHLGTGMVHSCHHPTPHKIPLDEIEENPAALFNTSRLKKARRQMLNGERPSECNYCWRVEDDGGNSDRYYKSLESWAFDYHDDIAGLSGDENIFPSYLEVSFGNVCNMKCTYCGPEFSSKWVEELKQHGPYELTGDTKKESEYYQKFNDLESLNYRKRDHNPYIEAFWKWWPRFIPHLRHYRITGGEPLMSKDTFKSIDWLIENENKELDFSINTNLSVPDSLWNKFVDKIETLEKTKNVKRISIFTSVEGWGERAEYARTGMDFNLLKKRVEQLLEMDNIRVNIMAAFNIFSITSFDQIIDWVYDLKLKHNPITNLVNFHDMTGFHAGNGKDYVAYADENPSHELLVGLDIPYLRSPEFLDAHFCTNELAEEYLFPMLNKMSSMITNPDWNYPGGFEKIEFDKLKRIIMHRSFFIKKNEKGRENNNHIIKKRAQFYDFIVELDRRRGTDFLKTFPEMTDFFNECKACKERMS